MKYELEDIQIFEEATVESNIITLQKGKTEKPFQVCNLSSDYIIGESISEYFNDNSFLYKIPETTEWIIGNEKNNLLKFKIEIDSKLLKDYNINDKTDVDSISDYSIICKENKLLKEKLNKQEELNIILNNKIKELEDLLLIHNF